MGDLSSAITALAVAAGIASAAIMGLLFWIVPWLWDLIRPWPHAVAG
ncbi:MAG: hypothetical protein KUL86_10765 [Castellaniella sp.]|nr:hypothetical protein [Castellaniella sp.]